MLNVKYIYLCQTYLKYFSSNLLFALISCFLAAGWSAKVSDAQQFLSILFYSTVVVKGIQTGGRRDTDEWVTKYKIQYQETYYAKWLTYQDPPGTEKVNTTVYIADSF